MLKDYPGPLISVLDSHIIVLLYPRGIHMNIKFDATKDLKAAVDKSNAMLAGIQSRICSKNILYQVLLFPALILSWVILSVLGVAFFAVVFTVAVLAAIIVAVVKFILYSIIVIASPLVIIALIFSGIFIDKDRTE